MTPIIVCRDGDRSTRGTVAGRSPLLAAQHSRLPGSGFVPLDLGDGSVSRPQRCGGCRRTTGHRTAIKFVPISVGVGSLIPGLRRALKPVKQSRCGFSQGFQDIILSAASRGLGLTVYGQHSGTRKSENVRQSGEKIHV